IDLKSVDLRSAVDSVWELLPYVSEDSAAQLVNRVSAQLPRVLADDQRLVQILFNLLNNALKHAEAKTIAVEAKLVGTFIEVAVIDDGRGIPAHQLDSIFEEFQQARTETALK